MGALFSGAPKGPSIPAPPAAAHPAILGSAQTALLDTTKKAGAAAEGLGSNDTVQTSPQGLKAPSTSKTLLGQ